METRRRPIVTRLALGFGALMLIAGGACTKDRNPLERPPGEATATTVEGAVVDAQVDVWPGSRDVLSEVTPVRVKILNGTGSPMRIQYENFRLVADDGTVYHALPPLQVEGTIDRPRAVYDPIDDPFFEYNGFRVAPYYGSVYPSIGVYEDYGGFDWGYYRNWYDVWYEVELPTRTMIRRALPEGVIDPGGIVDGFLYFERVDPEEQRVVFQADVVNAHTGQSRGIARLDFVVTED